MPNRRLFTEKEISVVLKHAAELQRTQGPSDPSGLSMEELQQIAYEAGIDPAYVETAVAALAAEPEADDRFYMWGGPTLLEEEHILDGEATEEDWEAMVGELRRFYTGIGKASRLGRTFEWTWKSSSGSPVHVTVSPGKGQTRIRIMQKLDAVAGGLYGGVGSMGFMFAILLPILLNLFPLVEAALSISAFAAVYFLTRWMYGTYARKEQRRMRQAIVQMEALMPPVPSPPAAEAISEAAPEAPAARPRFAAGLTAPDAPTDAGHTRNRTSA